MKTNTIKSILENTGCSNLVHETGTAAIKPSISISFRDFVRDVVIPHYAKLNDHPRIETETGHASIPLDACR